MEGASAFSADLTSLSLPKKKLGLFGGTFNPCHLGHLYIARQVRREFSLDKVLLIPSGDPPHKRGGVAGGEDRFAMCELLCAGEEYLSASRAEIDRPGVTYTVDTLAALRAGRDDELFFIIGSDTLFELTTWRDYQRVFSMTGFICALRTGDDPVAVRAHARWLYDACGARVELSSCTPPDISSTEIRERLRAGEDVSLLTGEAVYAYISQNGLYDE